MTMKNEEREKESFFSPLLMSFGRVGFCNFARLSQNDDERRISQLCFLSHVLSIDFSRFYFERDDESAFSSYEYI